MLSLPLPSISSVSNQLLLDLPISALLSATWGGLYPASFLNLGQIIMLLIHFCRALNLCFMIFFSGLSLSKISFLLFVVFLRGEGREKEREKIGRETLMWERNINLLPFIGASTRDPTHNLDMYPDQELNPWPFNLLETPNQLRQWQRLSKSS